MATIVLVVAWIGGFALGTVFGIGLGGRRVVRMIALKAQWDALRGTPPDPSEDRARYSQRLSEKEEALAGQRLLTLFRRTGHEGAK